MKKDSGLFDLAMGAFYEAQAYKLVTNILLHELPEKYEKKIWLYTVMMDRLAIFKNVSEPASRKIRKYFCKLFREHDLELKTLNLEKAWIS